jgi:hypothetical protein
MPAGEITMAIAKTRTNGSLRGSMGAAEVRLGLRLSKETLEGLAAWARAENRSPAAQGRLLIEQAVAAREDRLALTRR